MPEKMDMVYDYTITLLSHISQEITVLSSVPTFIQYLALSVGCQAKRIKGYVEHLNHFC